MTRVVTLLTDFGLQDPYVGMMKGEILRHCSRVQLVDLSHAIPPQNITLAARTIHSSFSHFPLGSIHLIVVDPGVGTDRSILVIDAGGHIFIAPDNGVLSPVLSSDILQRCHILETPDLQNISNTFHGRDLMAPLAGKIAGGMDIAEAGPEVWGDQCVMFALPVARAEGGAVIGEIIDTDHFGNVLTSISARDIVSYGMNIVVEVEGSIINSLAKTYGNVPRDELLTLIDSSGYLEISMNCGNAAKKLQCRPGQEVIVRPLPS